MLKQTGVLVVDTTAFWHDFFPSMLPKELTRQQFEIRTSWQSVVQQALRDVLPADVALTEEYAWRLGADEPLRTATDVIWTDYCIQHGLPPATPYTVAHTGEWTGVEIDVSKTPRELRLVAPEWWQKDFETIMWLVFQRA